MSKASNVEIKNALKVVQLKLKFGMIGGKTNKEFDMSTTYHKRCPISDSDSDGHDCGSVGCIGGYAEQELGKEVLYVLSGRLYKLFYPYGYGRGELDNWDALTSKKAVKAIQNYLDGKADPWKGVAKRNTNKDYLEG